MTHCGLRRFLGAFLLFLSGLGVASRPLRAEGEGAWLPLGGNPDPLRLAVAPFGFEEVGEPAAPGWAASFALTELNVWRSSAGVQSIHGELGRGGLPLSSLELRELESRDPSAQHLHVDLEGSVALVSLSRTFAGGATVSIRFPWVSIGSPDWDGIAEGWHDAIGSGNFGRGRFPRGQTTLYVRSNGKTFEAGETELAGDGLGDLSLVGSIPVSAILGGTQRLALVVEAPTGEKDSLRGNGGWDVGLRAGSAWQSMERRILLAAGWTHAPADGGLPGLRRQAELWHVGVDWQERLGARWIARAAVTWERGALDLASDGILADPSLFLRLGLGRRIGAAGFVMFELGQDQDSGNFGLAPDFSFHLTAGGRM